LKVIIPAGADLQPTEGSSAQLIRAKPILMQKRIIHLNQDYYIYLSVLSRLGWFGLASWECFAKLQIRASGGNTGGFWTNWRYAPF